MATDDAFSQFSSQFNPILSDLQHHHKAKRRKALEKYMEVVFETDKVEDSELLVKILDSSIKLLITCMGDESEMNRVNATNIMLKFIEKDIINDSQLITIIPTVHHRLATVPIIEESEEVRLSMVQVINDLTTIFKAKLIPYMNDVVNILKQMVIDSSPEVRKLACECVSNYAISTKDKFQLQSESLVKPLLKALHHQRFRNRIACIRALGDILLYGDNKSIQDISGPLAQCSLDLPQVRLVLVTVGGELATTMPDRYSYWHRILPILLIGIQDDDSDVQQKAKKMWMEVGTKYEQENMDQLEQEIDFDIPLENYPPGEVRPGVGCRTLVQKSLVHILPGLLTDLDDWQEGPRLQAAKLLTTLVLTADKGATQYSEKILTALHLAAGDKEPKVVKEVLKCSKYLGHFLEPSTYLPLVLPRLESGNYGERPLAVLAALISGTQDIQPHLSTIIKAISCEEIANVLKPDHQDALIQLTEVLLEKCNPEESAFEIFQILLFIASSSGEKDISNSALEQLDVLAQKTGCENLMGLFCKHTKAVMQTFFSTAPIWKEISPHYLMFVGLLELAGEALGHNLEDLVNVLSACVGKTQDPFVVLGCLSRLRTLLAREDEPFATGGHLDKFLPTIVSECIGVFLPWSAGQTAETLRTAAVACLAAVCRISLSHSQPMSQEIKKCFAIIPTLIEDDAEDTRLFSCEVILWTVTNYPQLIDSDTLHILADKLVKRFDDVNPNVRLRSAKVLSVMFTKVPENYDPQINSGRLLDLYEAAVIFLDDPDIKLQDAVLDALSKMGSVCPEPLIKTLEEGAPKYRNSHHCYQLINSLKNLNLSTDK